MTTQRVRRRLLYVVAAGVLAAAVLVWLFPEGAGQIAVVLGRALTKAWFSMLLVAVAVLIAAAARSRGTTQRPGQGPQLPLLVHVALLLGLALGVAGVLWVSTARRQRARQPGHRRIRTVRIGMRGAE